MNTHISLQSAIVSFFSTGVMAPHPRTGYEAPRVVSQSANPRRK